MHALTREVAYGSLTTPTRARLHARYADWLEVEGGGRDEDAAALAHHYAEAVRPEDVDLAWPGEEAEAGRLQGRAVAWLRRAATLAAGRYEMREAVALLERAVELEADPRTRRDDLGADRPCERPLLRRQGVRLRDGGGHRAGRRGRRARRPACRAGVSNHGPGRHVGNGTTIRPRAALDRAALELAAPDTSARAKALIARCYADYDKSAEDAAEASAIADRLGDPVLRSRGYDVRHLVAFVHGDYREALEWCRRRESFVHELADADTATYVYAFAINPAVACGELDEARRYARLHDDATRPLSPHHRLHGAALLLLLEELLGNWEQALELQELIETRVEESAATPCVLQRAFALLVRAGERASGQRRRDRAARGEGRAARDERVRDGPRHAAPAARAPSRRSRGGRVAARGAGRPGFELVLPQLDGRPP